MQEVNLRIEWSAVPERDSSESTLRLIASPSIKDTIIDIKEIVMSPLMTLLT